ncbi:MAG: MobC family plasmid mobilization relaxosome protein [Clostridiales bacterium]|nr:MobC family plasmid mobilization relaxosome protein [Clostridiales bacterium]
MSGPEPRRTVNFHFRTTEDEAASIRARMEEIGVFSLGAYLRKMAIDGYHVTLDLTDVREMAAQLRRVGLNVNQIAKRCNETRSIHADDVEDLRRMYDGLWAEARKMLDGLAKVK